MNIINLEGTEEAPMEKLSNLQKKTLSRLCYICEYSPCNTIPFDYQLQKKGLLKIEKYNFQGSEYFNTNITKYGLNKIDHLRELQNEVD